MPIDTTNIEEWMNVMGFESEIPSVYEIWKISNKAFKSGDKKRAKLYQNMNKLLHNSSVPYTAHVGKGVNFAYGGIGLIIHFNSIIEDYATIGSHVTLGGRGGSLVHYFLDDGTRMGVPRIGKYSYIATGSKILGGIDVGACSIVGANSVVLDHVPACSVVAGTPAKIIATINKENFRKYKNNFTQFRKMSDEEVFEIIDSYSNVN